MVLPKGRYPACSGTISPSTSPNYVVLPPVGGCADEWVVGGDYEEGDRVSANGLVFECKAWPFGAHCPQAGYRPLGSTIYPDLWKLSWKTIGHCEGTIAPSASPVAHLECSDAYDLAEQYPVGSKVSFDGINYECTALYGCAVGDVPGVSPNWVAISSCADSEIMLSNKIH
jgi:hypothetical protein